MSIMPVKEDLSVKKSKYGYDEYALRSAIAMAGIRNVGDFLGTITGFTSHTALIHLRNGDWSRVQIANIIYALQLTDDQVFSIFFNGREAPKRTRKQLYSYMPWEDRRKNGLPPNVAEKLDDLMGWGDDDE